MSRQVLLENPGRCSSRTLGWRRLTLVAPSSPPSPHLHPRESSGQPAGGTPPCLPGVNTLGAKSAAFVDWAAGAAHQMCPRALPAVSFGRRLWSEVL